MLCRMVQHKEQLNVLAPNVAPLHASAEDNLRYIRASMEAASSFTAVSGLGYLIAGASALLTALVASLQSSDEAWFTVWMLEAFFAGGVVLVLTARKADIEGASLWSGPGKKLLSAFLPTVGIGALLTLALAAQGSFTLLPGIWLGHYGAAVMTAGAHSVRIIPLMGALFMLLAAVVLFTPVSPDLMLALSFGGLHLIFGFYIWRQHGG